MMMSRQLARTLRFDRRKRWVDSTLYRRALSMGYTIYATHPWGYMLNRHGRGHTWQADDAELLTAERQRWPGIRHEIPEVLGEPGWTVERTIENAKER